MSTSTITTCSYIRGISHLHKVKGLLDTTKLFVVTKVMEGVRRTSKSVDIRSPITLDVLRAILPALKSICKSNCESTMFDTAFKPAFFAFRRVVKFKARSKNHNSSHNLLYTDVSINNSGMLQVCIRHSKSDQRGGSTVLVISPCTNLNIYPVHAVKCYYAKCLHLSNQLFIRHNGKPLTRYQFSKVF